MGTRFGETMKSLRDDAGLSLNALARRITWSKAAVGHAESGARPVSPELAKALDSALNANGLLIALAAAERGRGRTVDDVRRRALLKGIAASGAVVAHVAPATGRVSASDVAPMVARTAELRKLDDVLGGADTFGLYLAELDHTRSMLAATTYSDATRRGLLALLAEQAQLAGWAAFDAGWFERSEILYATSRAAAFEAADPALLANALALDAYQRAFNGRPDPALADASCEAVTDHVPPGVRALVYDRASWTYAMAGSPDQAGAALALAAGTLAEAEGPPTPDWAAWVDAAEIDIMTGRCWSALRRPLRAVAPLERALADFPDTHARDKAIYSLALAEAYLHARELELAAQTINTASRLAQGLASQRPKMQLRRTLALAAAYVA